MALDPVTASAGASVLNTGGGIISTAMSNQANRKAADLAWKRNKKMWHMQNAYNTPLQQMQRFKEAGLNPNLIYGQGNPGNASSAPQYNPPTYEGVNPIPDFRGAAQMYFDKRYQDAQLEQVAANTALTQARVNTEYVNQALKGLGQRKLTADINKLEGLLPYQLKFAENQNQIQEQNMQKNVSQLLTMSQDRQQRELEMQRIKLGMEKTEIEKSNLIADNVYKRYSNELRKMGLTEKDGIVMRMLTNTFQGTQYSKGQTLSDWTFNFFKWLEGVMGPYQPTPTKPYWEKPTQLNKN